MADNASTMRLVIFRVVRLGMGIQAFGHAAIKEMMPLSDNRNEPVERGVAVDLLIVVTS